MRDVKHVGSSVLITVDCKIKLVSIIDDDESVMEKLEE